MGRTGQAREPRRSLTLLQGTFAFRCVPAALKLADEVAALDYAERRAAFKGNPVEHAEVPVARGGRGALLRLGAGLLAHHDPHPARNASEAARFRRRQP